MSADELRRLERDLERAVAEADRLAVAHDIARRRWRDAARARDRLQAQIAELRAGHPTQHVICSHCGHSWSEPVGQPGSCWGCGGTERVRGER